MRGLAPGWPPGWWCLAVGGRPAGMGTVLTDF